MSTEQTFYSDDKGVRITNTRAIFDSTTYSMANISSIRSMTVPAKRGGGIFLAIVGFILLIIGIGVHTTGVDVFGIIVLLLGILWAYSVKGEFHIMVTSASGESSALKSNDQDYIEKVTQAINEAIIHRG